MRMHIESCPDGPVGGGQHKYGEGVALEDSCARSVQYMHTGMRVCNVLSILQTGLADWLTGRGERVKHRGEGRIQMSWGHLECAGCQLPGSATVSISTQVPAGLGSF